VVGICLLIFETIRSYIQSEYGVDFSVYMYSSMSRKDILTLLKSSSYGDREYKIKICDELIVRHYNILLSQRHYYLCDDFILWCVKHKFYNSVCNFPRYEINDLLAKKILAIINKYDPATHPDISKLLEIATTVLVGSTFNNPQYFSFNEVVDLINRTSKFNSHIWGALEIMIRNSTHIFTQNSDGLMPYQIYLEKNLPYDPKFLCLLKDLPLDKLQLTLKCSHIEPSTLEKMIELGFNPNNKLLDPNFSKGRRLLHVTRNYSTLSTLIKYYHKQNINLDVEDYHGQTPLFYHMEGWLLNYHNEKIHAHFQTIIKDLIYSGANPYHITNNNHHFFNIYKNNQNIQNISTYVSNEYNNYNQKKKDIITKIDF
jgi:hypothetical protein